MTRSARPWLAPLVPLYRLALGARELGLRSGFPPVRRLRSPVISIGSLSAGGAGKTPLTLALARALTQASRLSSVLPQGSTYAGANRKSSCINIAVLSRGYGRLRSSPARVDPDGSVDDFGDEPLLLARQAGVPVYVAAQRYQAGLLAEREGPSPVIHLLDDGFQHRQLHRDIDIVLFSRRDRDDRLLPAGNLREPLSALRRATILALAAEEADLAPKLISELHWEGPVWRLHRRMEIPPLPELAGSPVVAFCGIARPDQFFAGLEAAGIALAARIAFPDHHRYTPTDLARLVNAAKAAGAKAFLTTEKDRVRLGPIGAQLAQTLPLAAANLHIEIEDEGAMLDALLASLPTAR